MKIVVLAGGLSPERNVSLSTGTMVTEALRALGHRAGLIDLYFGLETGGADEAFFDAPVSEAYKKISREAPDLDQVRRGRKGDSPSMFGPGSCAGWPTWYSWPSTAPAARMGGCRPPLI